MTTREEPATSGLRAKLEPLLPRDSRFGIHHISTPPTKSAALCSAPPNERPDRTFCESHFLAVSIEVPEATTTTTTCAVSGGAEEESPPRKKRVLVLGVEVLLYSTVHSTTLFVSKADSTGYLHLLGLARGTPSPVREVCGAFVAHLVETRRRKGRQFVVSLFARAQSQYLFPGSAGNGGKHVLDDRGLVRWWCRVLSPLLEKPSTGNGGGDDDDDDDDVRGYLVVPGLEEPETRALLPPSSRVRSCWTLGHPLERISHYTREGRDRVPPRCLIPRYPDDPKSRFRDELDEEAARSGGMRTAGNWRSVKTLDVFWEMMAFRQECSSGRMTGFVWVVLDDDSGQEGDASVPKSADAGENKTTTVTLPSRQALLTAERRRRQMIEKKKAKKLRGIVVPRQPRIKTEQKRRYLLDRPTRTRHYFWPAAGRGDLTVSETSYRRGVELLLHLDFATLDKAVGSTRRWIQEVGMGSSRWGYEVTGTREVSPPPLPTCDARNGGESQESSSGGKVVATESSGQVNNLSGLVKRKRSVEQGEAGDAAVRVLGEGLVRKKAKKDVSSG